MRVVNSMGTCKVAVNVKVILIERELMGELIYPQYGQKHSPYEQNIDVPNSSFVFSNYRQYSMYSMH